MAGGGIVSLVKKVGTLIDSMSVRGVDRRYIDAPEKPWQLILKSNVSQTILRMKSDGLAAGKDYDFNAKLKTVPSQYVGMWAGYRGYGFGYSVNVGGDKGSYLTFGATGGSFGLNVRVHSFESSKPTLNMESELLTEEDFEEMAKVVLVDPIRVKTVIADGYYMFNGLMYNYTHIDYSANSNGDLIYLMDGVGRVKLYQASVGVGYAYNWVPVRGLLVNVMAMPMLTFVNKLKAYGYATNIEEMMEEDFFWDNTIPYDEWDKLYYSKVRVIPIGEQTFNSGLSIGFDTRASLTYNFGRYFINAYGQFNNIRYHHDSTNGYLNDWFINASIGIRL